MTTPAKRPTLARKVTPGTEKKRDDALNAGLRVTFDDVVYEARLGDVTPAIARELRQRTGMGFFSLMSTLGADPDIDLLSAFVWVSRRIAGEYVAFDDVAVTYADMLSDGFDIDVPGAEVDDGSPEVSGGGS